MKKLNKYKYQTLGESKIIIKPNLKLYTKSKTEAWKNKYMCLKKKDTKQSSVPLSESSGEKPRDIYPKIDFRRFRTKFNINKRTEDINENMKNFKEAESKYSTKKNYFSENTNILENMKPIIIKKNRKLDQRKFRTSLNISKKIAKESLNESITAPIQVTLNDNKNSIVLKYNEINKNDLNKDEDNEINNNEDSSKAHLNTDNTANGFIHYHSMSDQQTETENKLQCSEIRHYSKFTDTNKVDESPPRSRMENKNELLINKTDGNTNVKNDLCTVQNDCIETANLQSFMKSSTSHVSHKNSNELSAAFTDTSVQSHEILKMKENLISEKNKSCIYLQTDFDLLNNDQNPTESITESKVDQPKHFSTVINNKCSLNSISENCKSTPNSKINKRKRASKLKICQAYKKKKLCITEESNNTSALNVKNKISVTLEDKKGTIQTPHVKKQTIIDKYFIKNSKEIQLNILGFEQEEIKIKENTYKKESYHQTNLCSNIINCDENGNKTNFNCMHLKKEITLLENNNIIGDVTKIDDNPLGDKLDKLHEFNKKSVCKQTDRQVHFNSVILHSNELPLHQFELCGKKLNEEEHVTDNCLTKDNIAALENSFEAVETNVYDTLQKDIEGDNSLELEMFSISVSQLQREYKNKQSRIQQWLKEINYESIQECVDNNKLDIVNNGGSQNFTTSHLDNNNSFELRKEDRLERFSTSVPQLEQEYEIKQSRIQRWLKNINCESIQEYIDDNKLDIVNDVGSQHFTTNHLEDENDMRSKLEKENYVYINEKFFDENVE